MITLLLSLHFFLNYTHPPQNEHQQISYFIQGSSNDL